MSNLLLITLFNVSIFFKYKYLKAKLNFNKKKYSVYKFTYMFYH